MKYVLVFILSLCITAAFAQTSVTGKLSGASSSDPDGSITGYSWALDSACNGCTVSFSANTSQTTNATFTVVGTYKISLVVKDNEGALSDKAYFYVRVSQNIKPKAVITGDTDLRLSAMISKTFKHEFPESNSSEVYLYIESVNMGM